MKKLLYLAAVCAALMSCKTVYKDEPHDNPGRNDSAYVDENGAIAGAPAKKFTFHVKGAFDVSFNEMTRASVRLENNNTAGITDLWVLDYAEDGTLLQQAHQTPSDANFGHPEMQLTYGHHDVKFIASKGTGASLTASGISWTKVHDTFVLDYPVDVVASSNGNRAPELKRAVSGLRVVISDAIPADAKTIVLTLGSRSQSLTLPGLSALPYSESSVELDCSGNVGVSGAAAAVYTLAGDEEWTSTAYIAVKRADGTVITSFDLPEVELKKNRITQLTGEVFNRTSGFLVAVDSEWDTQLDMTF